MNIRNTKRSMSGTNTYKEHLQCNEKKWNIKNIDIVFDPRQLFDFFSKFYRPTPSMPPTLPTPKFFEPKPLTPKFDPRHPRTHATYVTHSI